MVGVWPAPTASSAEVKPFWPLTAAVAGKLPSVPAEVDPVKDHPLA